MYKLVTYYIKNYQSIHDYKMQSACVWNDHVVYTRNVIVSNLATLADTAPQAARLLRNQEDIGDLLRPYYSATDVDQVVSLLNQHIAMAVSITQGIKNNEDVTAMVQEWRNNCDAIVAKLIEMIPGLAQSTFGSLWDTHLTLTLNEIEFRTQTNWSSDIMNFDQILENSQEIAKVLSTAVIEQFPIKFCNTSDGEHT